MAAPRAVLRSSLSQCEWDNSLHEALGVDTPEDPDDARRQWPHTTAALYVAVPPTPVDRPTLVSASESLARALGLVKEDGETNDETSKIGTDERVDVASSHRVPASLVNELGACVTPPGARPVAHCYAGHQFGNFAGQLGDGRAISIGTVRAPAGVDDAALFNIGAGATCSGQPAAARVELQWKGSGLTPFSRTADGRAVLRSSIREFLCSEAMHALGVPTTRALSLVSSDTHVIRDPLYDGHVVRERACVVVRAAPCFVRFGTFEVFKPVDPRTGRAGPKAARPGDAGAELGAALRAVAEHHFPDVVAAATAANTAAATTAANSSTSSAATAPMAELLPAVLEKVAARTARMVALWMSTGFCHGVLNTDNLSIVGVTIDYGPFGFLDRYDPDFACNHSDDGGRYTYARQPEMCRWNVAKLVEALAPVVVAEDGGSGGGGGGGSGGGGGVGGAAAVAALSKRVLAAFDATLASEMDALFLGGKLGLGLGAEGSSYVYTDADRALLSSLLELMRAHGADWTVTWRALAGGVFGHSDGHDGDRDGSGNDGDRDGDGIRSGNRSGNRSAETAAAVVERIVDACADPAALARLRAPSYSRAQLASIMRRLESDPALRASVDPREIAFIEAQWAKSEAATAIAARDPAAVAAEAREAFSAWVSRYASRLQALEISGVTREQLCAHRRAHSPRIVLRNWVAQKAIEAAEAGDLDEFERIYAALRDPYAEPAAGSCDGDRDLEGPPGDKYAQLCVSCSS
jgi:uncharacterized protein YdiU (UPF0061 family)